jgi:hypothetical protein
MSDQHRTLEIDVKVDNRDLKKKTKDAEKQLSGIAKKAKSMGPLIAGAFGTAALAGFSKAVFDTAKEFERLETMLKTATGSAKNASVAFDGIKKFATETPFTVAQVTEAFIKLKNLGLDPSMESLEAYGNIASSMGKDVMQFVEAVADASVGEFERLKEFGIKASKEGENVAFRFKGTTTVVKNTSEEIQNFLRGIGESDFAGAMTDQMNTMNGAISNAGVAFDNFADAIGEKIGPTVIELANAFAIAADQLRALIDPTTADEIKNLEQELQGLTTLLQEAEDPWTGNIKLVDGYKKQIAETEAELAKLKQTETERAEEFKKIQGGQKTPESAAAAATEDGGIFGPSLPEEEQQRRDALQMIRDESIAKMLEAEQAGFEQMLSLKTEYDKAVTESEKAKEEQMAAIRKEGMNFFSNLQALASSESKTAFKISQAAAIGETTVNTYKAAQSAYSALAGIPVVGPALGAAAAAAAIAAGVANVQKIKATKFGGGGGAGGGSAPSGATGGSPSNQFGTAPVSQPTNVTPQGGAPQIKVISGNTIVGKLVEEEIIPAINDAMRRGVSLELEFN